MKSYEFLRENKEKMPHLYLDMDGVQADFFGHWARTHGVEHYKDIPTREATIQELAHSTPEAVYEFFRDLEPLSGGMAIIRWLHKNKIPFTVLSAPLTGPYSNTSIKAKKEWLDDYNPGTSSNAIFTGEKYKYATDDGSPNVLVDDFGKYIDAWNNAGGIGIKHSDDGTANTLRALEKIYKPYLNKLTEK